MGGKTPVTRTWGTKIASEQLKGRVFEICLADLNKDEDQAYRKIKLQCEEVQGSACLTQFYGLDFTTDKLRSMVRKWQSLIEAFVDVKTTDGYVLRLFCIGFTKKRQNQLKKTCYANSSQQKLIRKKMRDIMTKEASIVDLKELVNKFIPESIGKEIEKSCHGVYPMQNVHIRKVNAQEAEVRHYQALGGARRLEQPAGSSHGGYRGQGQGGGGGDDRDECAHWRRRCVGTM